MSAFHLAQLNIAEMLAPLDSPTMADFVANLARINALSEESPGFVWRLKGIGGDATGFRPFGENTLVNMSVWEDVESLRLFVYKSAHIEIMRRKREWFTVEPVQTYVLWWVPAGHEPTVGEAKERLELLRVAGPTPGAFNFQNPFDALV